MFDELKSKGIKLCKTKIKLDNSGENRDFKEQCHEKEYLHNYKIQFEWTPLRTPEYNGKVKRKFPTLLGRTRAMLNKAKIEGNDCYKFWTEAANTATKLDGLLVKKNTEKCADEIFFGKIPKFSKHFVSFGKLGIVAKLLDGTKLDNKGEYCVMLGYADDTMGDVYRLYRVNTGKVVKSKDVEWSRFYFEDVFKCHIPKIVIGGDYYNENIPEAVLDNQPDTADKSDDAEEKEDKDILNKTNDTWQEEQEEPGTPVIEERKRDEYRKIKPKRKIVFNLEENVTLEFRKEQIVKLHDVDLSSANRN